MKTLWKNTNFFEKIWMIAAVMYSIQIAAVIYKFCDNFLVTFFLSILPSIGVFVFGLIIGRILKYK